MPHKDPAVKAAYHRDYKRANRWRYARSQRIWDSTRHANERAAGYGAPGVLTTEEVAAIFAADACSYCGSRRQLGLDHVKPLVRGGLNRPENIVLCCQACNASKWRVAEPWQWSRRHPRCIDCGTTEKRHCCHGLCSSCYQRWRWHVQRGARQWPKAA